jgi:hypothetical protein
VSPDKNLAAKLRELLDRLAGSRELSNDEREEIHDGVVTEAGLLSGDGFLEALDSAIGKSKSRRRESVYLLSEFTHLPEVVARIGEELKNPDSHWRHFLVQTIGNKNLTRLAPQLIPIIESDPDILCRRGAIWSAGKLKAPECLPSLLRLAENPRVEVASSLALAFTKYSSEASRPFLQQRFEDKSADSSDRVIAAWGLAKLGKKKALRYLVKMLFDPNKKTPTSYAPGQSLRAAQAVCDIKGWQFNWSKSFVEAHRDEWRKVILSELESGVEK